ncbi:redoxin family protein [Sphingobacterium spiritivorum]|uniref:redoxin family protein n=1 Tax=Sphingobacterium spiritivorum TaxID=258 RepID=UPI003DA42782
MKKIATLIFLCIYVSIVWGQGKKTRIRLDVSPLKVDSMWVSLEDGKTEPQKLKPDATGMFEFSTFLERSTDGRVSIDNPVKGSIPLYLEPGDDLLIRTDFKNNTGFSGTGAENAGVLKELMDLYLANYNKLDATKIPLNVLYEQNEQMNKANLDFLDNNKSKVSKSFYDHQRTKFYYEALGMEVIMPYLLSQGLNKKLSETLPPGYMDLMKKVKFSEALLAHDTYNRFVRGTLPVFLRFRRLNQLGQLDSASTLPEAEKRKMEYEQVKEHLSGKIRSLALFGIVNNMLLSAKDVNQYKDYIKQFAADGGSKEQVAELQRVYDQALKLAAGAEPPPFTLNDINGKQVSLKDFAGKVIYIDFWASWCSPCRYEMKNGSPKLHAKLADNKDVIFLYISIDDSEDKWRQAIAEDKIKGIHLLSKGGVKSLVAKAFNISGIPRYVIIGRDGKIIDNDAPRPSQDITYDKIIDALKSE